MANKDENTMISFLSEYASISKELEEVILKYSGIKTLKKGSIILREGQISNECFFVLKGCVKKYYLVDGEEKITGFYTEGQIVTPASYTNRAPSKYYISTLEDTIAAFGDPESENEAMEKYPELAALIMTMTERLMVDISDEFDSWASHSPEERYLLLVESRPELIQRVPQYQIANYLGMKPESLSRIKKRLLK